MTGLPSYFMTRLCSIELAGRRLFVVASEWQEERRSKESSTASCMLAVVKSQVLVRNCQPVDKFTNVDACQTNAARLSLLSSGRRERTYIRANASLQELKTV